jgi:hypothetical protein
MEGQGWRQQPGAGQSHGVASSPCIPPHAHTLTCPGACDTFISCVHTSWVKACRYLANSSSLRSMNRMRHSQTWVWRGGEQVAGLGSLTQRTAPPSKSGPATRAAPNRRPGLHGHAHPRPHLRLDRVHHRFFVRVGLSQGGRIQGQVSVELSHPRVERLLKCLRSAGAGVIGMALGATSSPPALTSCSRRCPRPHPSPGSRL